jgi:hypothetical protein
VDQELKIAGASLPVAEVGEESNKPLSIDENNADSTQPEE